MGDEHTIETDPPDSGIRNAEGESVGQRGSRLDEEADAAEQEEGGDTPKAGDDADPS